jgi:type III secretion system needle length determinant
MKAAWNAYPSDVARNVQIIQELSGRIQSLLRETADSFRSRLSMDFESRNFGQTHLSVQTRDGHLAVSLQVGSESSRQQLMQQRDDLAQHLRQLGYRQVTVDVSTQDGNNSSSRGKFASYYAGNADAENVRLAGDDRIDLSEILAGSIV